MWTPGEMDDDLGLLLWLTRLPQRWKVTVRRWLRPSPGSHRRSLTTSNTRRKLSTGRAARRGGRIVAVSNRRKLRSPLLDMTRRTFLERRKMTRRQRAAGNAKRRRVR